MCPLDLFRIALLKNKAEVVDSSLNLDTLSLIVKNYKTWDFFLTYQFDSDKSDTQ